MSYYKILQRKILPKWYSQNKNNKYNVLIVGCNSGEEVYNFAILLSEFNSLYKNFDFQILAIDSNEKYIEFSKRGVYQEESIKHIPLVLKKKYFLKSKDRTKKLVKIAPELREKISFRKIASLNDISFREKMDLIKINRKEFINFKMIKKLTTMFNKHGYMITCCKNFLISNHSQFKEIFPNVYCAILNE